MVYLRFDDLMRIRDHVSQGQGARIEATAWEYIAGGAADGQTVSR